MNATITQQQTTTFGRIELPSAAKNSYNIVLSLFLIKCTFQELGLGTLGFEATGRIRPGRGWFFLRSVDRLLSNWIRYPPYKRLVTGTGLSWSNWPDGTAVIGDGAVATYVGCAIVWHWASCWFSSPDWAASDINWGDKEK